MVPSTPMMILMESALTPVRPSGKSTGIRDTEDFTSMLSDASLATQRNRRPADTIGDAADSEQSTPEAPEEKNTTTPNEDRGSASSTETASVGESEVAEGTGGGDETGDVEPVKGSDCADEAIVAEQTSPEDREETPSSTDSSGQDEDGEACESTTLEDNAGDEVSTDTSDSPPPAVSVPSIEIALLQALGCAAAVNSIDTQSVAVVSSTPMSPNSGAAETSAPAPPVTDVSSQEIEGAGGHSSGNTARTEQSVQGKDRQVWQAPTGAQRSHTVGVSAQDTSPTGQRSSDEVKAAMPRGEPGIPKTASPSGLELRQATEINASVLEQGTSEPETRVEVDLVRPARTPNVAVEVARLLTDMQGDETADETLSPASGKSETIATQSTVSSLADATSLITSGGEGSGKASVDVKVIGNQGQPASVPLEGITKTSDEATDRIVRVTQASAGQHQSHVRLQLDPPDLGQVRIDVKIAQGSLSISIQAETEAARDLLQSRFEGLRQGLADHGLQVNRFEIELRGSHQSNADTRNSGSDQGGNRSSTEGHPSFGQSNDSGNGSWQDSYRPGENPDNSEYHFDSAGESEWVSQSVDVTV